MSDSKKVKKRPREDLERELQNAGMLIMAMMDQIGITEIRLTQKTMTELSGGLASAPDIVTGDSVLRRTK